MSTKQKIGVWGLGVGGTATLKYIGSMNHDIQVMDQRTPNAIEQELLTSLHAKFVPQTSIETFLQENMYIIPSSGIDISAYSTYSNKWLSELDIFTSAWHKPMIAITGSLGKTSIVHLLSRILTMYGKKVVTGGNIGTGLLDLVAHQETHDLALIELSSFQLEYSKTIAPDLAIITNLYANHLDRHRTFEQYLKAKLALISYQKQSQKALLPFSLYERLMQEPHLQKRSFCFFSPLPVSEAELAKLGSRHTLYCLTNTQEITVTHMSNTTVLANCTKLPRVSYSENWLIITAACHMLKLPIEQLYNLSSLDLPAHRLSLTDTIKGVAYYNDSKSTVPEATLIALKQFTPQRVHLFLGGISKGVDRKEFIAKIPKEIKEVLCFGAEADMLHSYCKEFKLASFTYDTLEQAFDAVVSKAQSGDIVLFSPAGASFDLFKNYQERGIRFEELVKDLAK